MSVEFRFLHPVDVVFFRSNRLFDAAGSWSEALMPPPPSVFSGALRSFLMAEKGFDPERFREHAPPGALRDVLGEAPEKPGSFRVTLAAIAKAGEIAVPLPADLVAFGDGDSATGVEALTPTNRKDLEPLRASGDLPMVPVLRSANRSKPLSGLFLGSNGLKAYQSGARIDSASTHRARDIWKTDSRLGIGMETATRRVQEGKLYTSDGVSFCDKWGFAVGVTGSAGLLPKSGLLRLGGDGHGAEVRAWNAPASPPWEYVPKGNQFRMILATPGLFPGGWLPPGISKVGPRDFRLEYVFGDGTSFRARLAAAAVNRSEVISGWNLADASGGSPKPAQRTVNPGSVYWFDQLEGKPDRFFMLLRSEGLWPLMADEINNDATGLWKSRRAEGFNNVWFGEWKG